MQILNQLQRITLYLFFFSLNFEIWSPFGISDFSIAKLTAIIYFLSILPQLHLFVRTENLKSVLIPITIFLCFLTFRSWFNINELYYDFFDRTIFLNIVIFWFLVNHERKDYMILEKAMLSFAVGSMFLCLLFFIGIGVEYQSGRLSMFGDNQNGLGLHMAISLMIILTVLIQNRLKIGRIRYSFLIAIPFMLIFIGETGSRVSAIAFVLMSITGILLYKTKTNLTKSFVILGGFIFVILIGILLLQSDTMKERIIATSESGDLGERDRIWRTILPIIKENPLIGIGKTGYQLQSTEFFGFAYSPHNVILEILCYTGIIGLMIYLTFLFQVFIRGYQIYKLNGWLLPVLLIIPILGYIFSGQILDYKIGWVIFAYIISASAIKYHDQPKEILSDENSLFH